MKRENLHTGTGAEADLFEVYRLLPLRQKTRIEQTT